MQAGRNQSDPDILTHPAAPAYPPTPPPPAPSGPLNEQHFALIRQASARRKVATKAARVAMNSCIVTLFLGISAVPLVLIWPSWTAGAAAAGLCVIGVVEYKGGRRMRQADPTAARILGINQLAFMGLIILYCLVQMLSFSPSAALSAEVRSQLADLPNLQASVSDIDHLAMLVTYGFYGLVIVASVLSQGGLAVYYFTRRSPLEAYNRQTPPWIRRLLTETSA